MTYHVTCWYDKLREDSEKGDPWAQQTYQEEYRSNLAEIKKKDIWTISTNPDEEGWETDTGTSGYGLTYEDAKKIVDLANRK